MPSTYSTNLKIELIALGEQVGTWGTTTNTNLGTALEQAIVGRVTVTFTTDANKTLTISNSNAAQDARAVFLNLASSVSLTTTRDLIVPAITKNYIVKNGTTGGQSVRVIVAGTGVTIPNGKTALIFNDAVDVTYQFDHLGTLDLSGALTVAGNSTFGGTGSLVIPVGTTAQQTGGQGAIRYNTSFSRFEGNNGSSWGALGGGATGGGADQIFFQNGQTVTTSYTITTNYNAMTTGPITINNGVTVTVPSGSRWVVL